MRLVIPSVTGIVFRDLVEPGLEWCGDVVGVSSGMSGVDPDAVPTPGVASIDTGRPLSQPAVPSSIDEAHDTTPNTYWGASTPGCDPQGLDADMSLEYTTEASTGVRGAKITGTSASTSADSHDEVPSEPSCAATRFSTLSYNPSSGMAIPPPGLSQPPGAGDSPSGDAPAEVSRAEVDLAPHAEGSAADDPFDSAALIEEVMRRAALAPGGRSQRTTHDYSIILELALTGQRDPEEVAFLLKARATSARSAEAYLTSLRGAFREQGRPSTSIRVPEPHPLPATPASLGYDAYGYDPRGSSLRRPSCPPSLSSRLAFSAASVAAGDSPEVTIEGGEDRLPGSGLRPEAVVRESFEGDASHDAGASGAAVPLPGKDSSSWRSAVLSTSSAAPTSSTSRLAAEAEAAAVEELCASAGHNAPALRRLTTYLVENDFPALLCLHPVATYLRAARDSAAGRFSYDRVIERFILILNHNHRWLSATLADGDVSGYLEFWRVVVTEEQQLQVAIDSGVDGRSLVHAPIAPLLHLTSPLASLPRSWAAAADRGAGMPTLPPRMPALAAPSAIPGLVPSVLPDPIRGHSATPRLTTVPPTSPPPAGYGPSTPPLGGHPPSPPPPPGGAGVGGSFLPALPPSMDDVTSPVDSPPPDSVDWGSLCARFVDLGGDTTGLEPRLVWFNCEPPADRRSAHVRYSERTLLDVLRSVIHRERRRVARRSTDVTPKLTVEALIRFFKTDASGREYAQMRGSLHAAMAEHRYELLLEHGDYCHAMRILIDLLSQAVRGSPRLSGTKETISTHARASPSDLTLHLMLGEADLALLPSGDSDEDALISLEWHPTKMGHSYVTTAAALASALFNLAAPLYTGAELDGAVLRHFRRAVTRAQKVEHIKRDEAGLSLPDKVYSTYCGGNSRLVYDTAAKLITALRQPATIGSSSLTVTDDSTERSRKRTADARAAAAGSTPGLSAPPTTAQEIDRLAAELSGNSLGDVAADAAAAVGGGGAQVTVPHRKYNDHLDLDKLYSHGPLITLMVTQGSGRSFVKLSDVARVAIANPQDPDGLYGAADRGWCPACHLTFPNAVRSLNTAQFRAEFGGYPTARTGAHPIPDDVLMAHPFDLCKTLGRAVDSAARLGKVPLDICLPLTREERAVRVADERTRP